MTSKICEECEDIISSVYCNNCDQNLCETCDQKIHNKGKRLLHKRIKIEDSILQIKCEPCESIKEEIIPHQNDEELEKNAPINDIEEANQLFNDNEENSNKEIQKLERDSENSSNSPNLNLLLQEEDIYDVVQEESLSNDRNDHLSNTKNYSSNQESYESKPYNIWRSQQQKQSMSELFSSKKSMNNQENSIIQSVSFFDVSFDQNQNQQQCIISKKQNLSFNQKNNTTASNQATSGKTNNSDNSFSLNIPVTPIEISYEQFFETPQNQFGQILQKFLIECAKEGDLLIKIDEQLTNKILNLKKPSSLKTNLEQIQDIEKQFKNINPEQFSKTIRKFGDSLPLTYISLHLKEISIESIQWILKSIMKDEMTPSEKLIFSRIKECYGFKLNQHNWNGILQYLKNMANCNGDIIFNQPKIMNMKIILNKEDISQNLPEQCLVYVKELIPIWQHGDTGRLKETDRELWKIFIQFLKEFFNEENSFISNDSKSSRGKNKNKWTSSVENAHSKNSKKPVIMPPKSINKAIPGGRYGAGQLLKCCGSLPLRSCSLGKLSLFVQEAINNGTLIYYKTLLIKPANIDFDQMITNFDEIINPNLSQEEVSRSLNIINDDKSFLTSEQQEKIQIIKQVIVEILQDNEKGVSLARLPKIIQKKIKFSFDLHSLGYPKLKTFLQSIENVSIQNDGTTYACVILKEEFNSKRSLSPNSYNKKFSTLKPEIKNNVKLMNNQKLRTFSNLDAYNDRVQSILQQIVQENPYGLNCDKLYFILSQRMQSKFEFSLFDCQSFNEYVSMYCESFTDIMIKMNQFIVYPKNLQKFAQMPQKQMFPQQTQQQQGQQLHQQGQQLHHQQSQKLHQQQQVQQGSGQFQQQYNSPNFYQNQMSPPLHFRVESFAPQTETTSNQNNESYQNEIEGNLKFIEELLHEDIPYKSDKSNSNKKIDMKLQQKKNKSTDLQFNQIGRNQGGGIIYKNLFTFGSGSYQNTDKKYSPLYINEIPETQEENGIKWADINTQTGNQHEQLQHKRVNRPKTQNFN